MKNDHSKEDKLLYLSRLFRIMRMSLTILLLSTAWAFSAESYSQVTKITLNMDNKSVREVLKAIENQSEFIFFYQDQRIDLDRKVNIGLTDKNINEVLDNLFEGTNNTCIISDRQILIGKSETEPVMAKIPAGVVVKDLSEQPQNKVISGTVNDTKSRPIPGVSVFVKNTVTGTVTDVDGKFTLQVPVNAKTLVFSFVGMKTQEFDISNRSYLNVTLAEELTQVGEVLVTGYQTITRERATGSFSTIKPEQIDKPTSNIAQRLIGATAGVQSRLDVDGNPTFEIRGQTSLNATKEPLVVIDGFPTEKGFSSINPNDVESITILKDAAAASIWGAKAANGVIVITSKKVSGGMPLRIGFNTFYKVGPKFDLNYVKPVASSSEVIDYELTSFNKWGARAYNIGNLDDGYNRTYTPTQQILWDWYSGKLTDAQRDTQRDAYRNLDNSQQIRDYLLDNPSTQQYNLTIMGGTEKMSNFLSLLHEKNTSNFQRTFSTRDVITLRNTAKVFRWLDFETGAVLSYTNANNSGVSLSDIQAWVPHQMLIDTDGKYTNIPNGMNFLPAMTIVPFNNFPYKFTYNPIEEINNRNLTARTLDTRVTAALFLKPVKGLTLESRVQYEFNNTFNKNIYNDNTYLVRAAVNAAASWTRTTNAVVLNLPKGGFLDQNRSEVKALTVRNQLNFNKSFDKHDITALAGVEFSDRVQQGYTNPRTYGYDDNKLTVGVFPNGPGGSTVKLITNWLGSNQNFTYVNGFSYTTRRYYSAYANASYTFDSKYTLTGSVRSDASNFITDDPKYRYAPFWSVGASWNASRENFMQNIEWVDLLTARLTFGYNGNVDVTTSFQPLITPSSTPNTYTMEYTTSIASLGNPTLRWEKTGTWNGGFDYSLFKGKLTGNIDFYRKYTRDLIATISIPSVNGSTTSKMNNAEMKNTGFEITVGTQQKIHENDIWWRGSVNFAYNKNEITKLFVSQIAASSLYGSTIGTGTFVQGYNSQEMWCFKYAGIKNEGTEAAPNWQPQVQGPGTTTYNFTGWTPGDGRDYLLHMGPKVAPSTFGFTSYFKIYDFNFSFIVTGKFGHVFARQSFNYPVWWNGAVIPNQKYSEVANGDPAKIVPLPLNTNEARYYFWDRFYPYLSYLVESASHIRMQEINLTYNVPQKLTQKISMGLMQLYVQCNDVFTVYSNKFGEDPEYPKGTQNPQPKFTFGLKFDL